MATSSPSNDAILTSIITNGDLSKLTQDQKVAHYKNFCERLGLDPTTQPFKLIRLNGKEILYCDRTGTQQLNKLHSVSHEIRAREIVNGCYVVTCQASTPDGRHTESIGAVPIENLRGDNLCNAMMKSETKSKRRATLDLLGLGVLDESETDAIPNVEAKMDAPVAAAVEKTPAKAGAPKEAAPAAKPAAEKKNPEKPAQKETAPLASDPFKMKYSDPSTLLEMLAKVEDITQLANLYYTNIEVVEKDDHLKAAFTKCKLKFTGANAYAGVYSTKAEIELLVKWAKNVEQLTSLFKANDNLIEKEELKQLFTDRRLAIAKEALEAAPADAADDELSTRPIEWFKERMNKEVWMDKPGGYIGRMQIESDDYPRWLAEEMQAEGARFRDVKADDPKTPES